jgi:hypothetical protein
MIEIMVGKINGLFYPVSPASLLGISAEIRVEDSGG